jgi:hypothetical protein
MADDAAAGFGDTLGAPTDSCGILDAIFGLRAAELHGLRIGIRTKVTRRFSRRTLASLSL